MRAYVDQIWGLEGDRATRRRTLTPDKNRWVSDLPQALALSWYVSDDGCSASLTAEPENKRGEEVVLRRLAGAETIGVLRQSLVESLAEAGIDDPKTIVRLLGKLAGQGPIKRSREGREARFWLAGHAPKGES